MDNKRFWFHLVPPNDTDSTQRVRDLFSCVATLMERQLRDLVLDSLTELLDFLLIHEVPDRFAVVVAEEFLRVPRSSLRVMQRCILPGSLN